MSVWYIGHMEGGDFEWDDGKDAANRAKHGVAFALAQRAFLDPARVIAEDLEHSAGEKRWFCFGRVGDGVMTVSIHLPGETHPHLRSGLLEKRKEDL